MDNQTIGTVKKRHWRVTAWLIFLLVMNSVYLLGSFVTKFPNASEWAVQVLTGYLLCNLVCVIALFKWKKWGFWGYVMGSVVGLALQIPLGMGIGISTVLYSVAEVVVLYEVLKIGKENNAWLQLE